MYAAHFFVQGIPAPKGSTKSFPYKGKDGRLHVATTAMCDRTKSWQESIRQVALDHKPDVPLEGAIELSVIFYFLRPKSVSEKKRPHHTVKPDLDKLLRSTKDAITGVIYRDDSQVISSSVRKEYGVIPGARIDIAEVINAFNT